MKKLLLFVCLLGFTCALQAQVIEYTAYEVASRSANDNWGNSQWEPVNQKIILNLSDYTVTFVTENNAVYKLSASLPTLQFGDGSILEQGVYTESNGTQCLIYVRYPASAFEDPYQTGTEVYVEYEQHVVVFRVRVAKPA